MNGRLAGAACLRASLALLLLAAAPAGKSKAPEPGSSLAYPATRVTLPTPPEPPPAVAAQEEGFRPAPVPNLDAEAPPDDPDGNKAHIRLVPSLSSKTESRPGEGYVPGSAANYDASRRWRPAPSLILKVPLQ